MSSTSTTGDKVKEGASGLKGLAAAVHGVGEEIRGTVNSSIDRAANEPTGVVKNDAIANQGRQETVTGSFSEGTKVREGVHPKRL
ncbi:hypothetical protein BP6252_11753 [Coleophoma cylindrospora]|uniref:Uncharacterized protein n=1 Tax=Coleophoma cylindrospora TaxID=1849047 RepID=A0A3D8QKY5_9HELO|nr:hypothetical protein BP6252_11753 [Coleophoma cylindrospora]